MSRRRKRGGRVPATLTAPHATAAPPRCVACDGIREVVETRPWEVDVLRLAELREQVAAASPPFGEMIRAKTEVGIEVWACPRHNSLERRFSRNARGRQTVEWRIVQRKPEPA